MKEKLADLALEVKALGPATVAATCNMKSGKLSRFVNDPLNLTMAEVERVERAVAQLRAAK
jgi:serine kinase of HPr protein (carbohydrate metabolism regulator)